MSWERGVSQRPLPPIPDSKAFDGFYDEKLLKSDLSDFQRSYDFVLEHGLDAVNADMQNDSHLKENFVAAATSHHYFA